MKNNETTVGLIVGGASAERAVSKLSGKGIYNALLDLNYKVKIIDPALPTVLFYMHLDGQGVDPADVTTWVKLDNTHADKLDPEDELHASSKNYVSTFCSDKMKKIHTAFIALHGTYGEDGMIQSILELSKIPYTGSGVLASSLSMNKGLTKVLLKHNGVTTPNWLTIKKGSENIDKLKKAISEKIYYPCVIKPNDQGSAIGLTICKDEKDIGPALEIAFKYSNDILIESYIDGYELTVGILDGLSLPPLEIKPKHDFYDYECKYTKGMSEYEVPANFPNDVLEELKLQALAAYKSIDCKSYGRIDFRVDKDHNVYCLEVNTLPGMTSTSLLPKTAKAAGISFEELVHRIVKNSLQ